MSEVLQIPIKDIVLSKDNPRGTVNQKDQSFIDLRTSIGSMGIKIPVVVREVNSKYELLAGARRVAAAKSLNFETVPAENKGLITDQEAFDITFAENYCREDLTIIEQSRAVELLMKKYDGDVAAVASKLGWDRQTVLCRERIGKMSPKILKMLENGELETTPAHLDLVARLPMAAQERVCQDVWMLQNRSVAELKRELEREYQHLLSKAPWNGRELKGLVDCAKCQKRSDHQSMLALYSDETGSTEAKCLDPKCWKKNSDIAFEDEKKQAVKTHGDALAFIVDGSASDSYQVSQKEGVRSSYSINPVKEGTPGAKPVFVLNGEHAGLRWFKPEKRESGKRGAPVAAPKTMKEKRKELESKRWCSTLQKLASKVMEIKSIKLSLKHVAALAVVFGTSDRNTNGALKQWNTWRGKVKEDSLEFHLFCAVRKVLVDSITYSGPITQLPDRYIESARELSALLDINIDDIYLQACEEIKEPKSWIKEEADAKAIEKDRKEKDSQVKKGK